MVKRSGFDIEGLQKRSRVRVGSAFDLTNSWTDPAERTSGGRVYCGAKGCQVNTRQEIGVNTQIELRSTEDARCRALRESLTPRLDRACMFLGSMEAFDQGGE